MRRGATDAALSDALERAQICSRGRRAVPAARADRGAGGRGCARLRAWLAEALERDPRECRALAGRRAARDEGAAHRGGAARPRAARGSSNPFSPPRKRLHPGKRWYLAVSTRRVGSERNGAAARDGSEQMDIDEAATRRSGSQMRVGLIGLGYWGQNYVRLVTVSRRRRAGGRLRRVERGARVARDAAGARGATTDPGELFAADDVDAVIVATPTSTHASSSLRALEGGQARSLREAAGDLGRRLRRRSIAAAEEAGSRRSSSATRSSTTRPCARCASSSESGEIGKLALLPRGLGGAWARSGRTSTRSGISRRTTWRSSSTSSAASPSPSPRRARPFLASEREDVVFAAASASSDGAIAGVHVSWLAPHKVRRDDGGRRLARWWSSTTSSTDEKLKIFDTRRELRGRSESARGTEFGE